MSGAEVPGFVSENGPREGTRDLPKRDADAGRRAVDGESLAGRAYRAHDRAERQRDGELGDLAAEGLSEHEILVRYEQSHPFERAVTREEVRRAVGRARTPAGRETSSPTP